MESSRDLDGIIDEDGNLFGVVNAIDALVVLFVLSVAVSGAVILAGNESKTAVESTYVTLDLGAQPDYIVGSIREGDTYVPRGNSKLTITDIYLAPQGNQTHAVVRAKLDSEKTGNGVNYVDNRKEGPPHRGRIVAINTDRYNVTGQIRDVGDDETLTRNTSTIVVKDIMSVSDATEVSAGDEIRIENHTVATIKDAAIYATGVSNQRTVVVTANVETYVQQGDRRFGARRLVAGQNVTFPTAEYTIDGRIERVDSDRNDVSVITRTATLEATELSTEVAAAIEPGMVERAGNETTARVTAVSTTPSPVIATAADGSIVVNDHPTLRDVTIDAELQLRERNGYRQFKTEPIQLGSTVVLDLETVTIEATVTSLEQ